MSRPIGERMPTWIIRRGIDEPLLDRVVEHRAVAVALTEGVRPGVDMGVEMDERHRTAPPRHRAQQRQRDRRDRRRARRDARGPRRLLDPREARRDVAEREIEVADVGERQGRGIDPMDGMRAVDEHAARLPDRRRPEPRAAPVGGADIERNAGDRDRRGAVAALDAEECRRNGIGRGYGHDWAGGSAKRNTAAATAQVQSPLAAPSAAAVIDRLSTMRSLSLVDALALVPCGVGIELDAQRRGEHGGGEILDIVA